MQTFDEALAEFIERSRRSCTGRALRTARRRIPRPRSGRRPGAERADPHRGPDPAVRVRHRRRQPALHGSGVRRTHLAGSQIAPADHPHPRPLPGRPRRAAAGGIPGGELPVGGGVGVLRRGASRNAVHLVEDPARARRHPRAAGAGHLPPLRGLLLERLRRADREGVRAPHPPAGGADGRHPRDAGRAARRADALRPRAPPLLGRRDREARRGARRSSGAAARTRCTGRTSTRATNCRTSCSPRTASSTR